MCVLVWMEVRLFLSTSKQRRPFSLISLSFIKGLRAQIVIYSSSDSLGKLMDESMLAATGGFCTHTVVTSSNINVLPSTIKLFSLEFALIKH